MGFSIDAFPGASGSLKISPVKSDSGYVTLASVLDEGTILGSRDIITLNAFENGALSVSESTRMMTETFPGSTMNSSIWTSIVSTMTTAQANGFLYLNAALSTASGAYAQVRSYRHFTFDIGSFVKLKMLAQFAQVPQANNVTEWGFGLAATTAAPTEGVFFRLTSAGQFVCVVNNNGTELTSAAINFNTYVGANTEREFYIIITDTSAQFFISDEVMCAEIFLGAAGSSLTLSQCLPVFFRTYNVGATSSAQQFKLGGVSITMEGTMPTKTWPSIQAGGMMHSSQLPTGVASAQTAIWANSAAPGAAVPANATANLATGLGGIFYETDTLAALTDGIIQSYQVPLGTATAPGRSLYISGIGISSFVSTVLVGGPYVAQFAIAYGHTAVSLATAEAATAKAPRRVPLPYVQAVTAAQAVSTLVGTPFIMTFDPIVIQPGEFIQLIKRKVGTAPSSGVITHTITYFGYWE